MAESITLRIITPERIVLDTDAADVRFPALDGYMGILPGHAPMVAALAPGELLFRDAGGEQSIFVSGGFAEVRDNTVRVVTEAGERPHEIDVERARAAGKRARELLATRKLHTGEPIDTARAEAALLRSLQRLRTKENGR